MSDETTPSSESTPEFRTTLLRAKQGDEDAKANVLRELQADIRGFVQHEVRQETPPFEVDDVLQTVLAEAWQSLACCRAEERDGVLAWLRSIIRHRIIDAHRHWDAEKRGGGARQVPPQTVDDRLMYLHELATNGWTGPLTGLLKSELREVIQEAVQRLPDAYRSLTKLCYFEGVPVKDAAAREQITEGAAYVRLSRARQMLGEEIRRRLGSNVSQI